MKIRHILIGFLICGGYLAKAQQPEAKMILDPANSSRVIVYLEWPANAAATSIDLINTCELGIFYSEPAGSPTVTNVQGTWSLQTGITQAQITSATSNPDSLAYRPVTIGTGFTNLGSATTAGSTDTLFKLTFPNLLTGRIARMLQATNGVGSGTIDNAITSAGNVPTVTYRPNSSTATDNPDISQSSSTIALPVELIHFTAQAAAHTTADLTWATASEIDNSHFMIERSYDGRSFEAIDRVEGNGNSSEVISYAYTDNNIAKGTQVAYYRLHQFDYNGVSEYSDVRKVTFGMNNLDEQNIAIYPNPFTSDVYIDVRTISKGEATITVTNINGQQLLERSINTTEQIEKVDLSSLTKGMYFVNVSTATETTIVKVIKR
jgi:hypothetical protein